MKIKPVGVGVIIKNKKILLVTDDEDEYKAPGGKVEDNEKIQETVVREVKEEISSEIKIISFIDTFTKFRNGVKYTMFNYRVKLLSELKPANEVKTIGWYDYKQCKKLSLSPDSRHLVELFHQKGEL